MHIYILHISIYRVLYNIRNLPDMNTELEAGHEPLRRSELSRYFGRWHVGTFMIHGKVNCLVILAFWIYILISILWVYMNHPESNFSDSRVHKNHWSKRDQQSPLFTLQCMPSIQPNCTCGRVWCISTVPSKASVMGRMLNGWLWLASWDCGMDISFYGFC